MISWKVIHLQILTFVLLALPGSITAQDSLAIAIHELVQSKMAHYQVPGLAVGVMKRGKIIYEGYLGYSNLQQQVLLADHHLFHTASISKLFTAQAIMQLEHEGLLNLDDMMVTLWPGFKLRDSRYVQITIRQMLNHTSGMPDVQNYKWGSNTSLEEYAKTIAKKKLHFAPGTEFKYSNMAYDLLGYLVERLSKMPFHQYMKEKVLLPAGMASSDFNYFLLDSDKKVTPYTNGKIGSVAQPRKVYPYNPAHAPSSTLNSNVQELLSWAHSLIDIQGSNALLFNKMTKPSSVSNRIGIGWFLGDLNGAQTAYHFGGDRGFRSYLLVVPEQQLAMVVLTNCDYSEDLRQDVLHSIFDQITKL